MKRLLVIVAVLTLVSCSESDTNAPSKKISSISLIDTQLVLYIGDAHTLAATILPASASGEKLVWVSANPSVATVNSQGKITALASGTTEITVSDEQGTHESACAVTVLEENQFIYNNQIWDTHNASVFQVKTNTGSTLQLDLQANALWYNASEGAHVYRMVTGNFTLTATVSAVKRTNNAQATDCTVCLGGLMARNPSASPEDQDYVHLVSGVTPGGHGAEIKSTTNSSSVYQPTGQNQLPFTDAQISHDLKILRVGNTFTLSKKSPVDSDWVLLGEYNRPDLPAALAVGVNIYTSVNGPAVADLSVRYENIQIVQ